MFFVNIFEFIGYVVCIVVDYSYDVCFGLNCVWLWLSNFCVFMGFGYLFFNCDSFVCMVCCFRNVMYYVLCIFIDFVVIECDEFFLFFR